MSYSWSSLAVMPSRRVFSTPIEVSRELYILGGCDVRGSPLGNLERYNPAKNEWTTLIAMPTKRAGTCALVVDNFIIALGGITTSQQPSAAVEIYDTETNVWTTGDGLIEELLGLSGVVRDGKVIIVGGMGTDTNPKDYLMEYDIKQSKWKNLPPMPTPRYATTSILIGSKLYVIGGRQGKVPVRAFEVYNFTDKKWRKLPDVPTPRVFAVYTHCDNYIHSLGGLQQDAEQGFCDTNEIFDLETEEWTVGPPMTTKRGDFATGVVGGRVIVAGGLGNQGVPLKAVEVYDRTAKSWGSLAEMPTAHCSCAYITFQQRLHLVGGLSVGGPTSHMEALQFRD